ncbi:MAG: hypothetical protein J6K28_03725 [Alistipes sp.]|nr:hypothetical protein [Alistipes sp.]
MKRIIHIFEYAAVGIMILATGCQRDTDEESVPNRTSERLPASLTLTLNAADIYRATIDPETRNLTAPDGDMSKWTKEDSLADGRTIRRLTVMLVDSISQEMVAYRHIIYNGNGIDDPKPIHKPLLCSDDSPEGGNGFVGADGAVDVNLRHSDRVRLTFNYDAPLHGNIERLKHGKYALIAVANYASLPKKEGEDEQLPNHDAVKNENGFVKQIHLLIHKFYGDDDLKLDANLWNEEFLRTQGKGIEKFGASMGGFYNYVLGVAPDKNGRQPYIRKKLDELPLFTVGYIDLQPGSNVLTEPIWLYRTYSRVRVEVKNYSTEPLSVNYLEFSDNFSKDSTYFCRMPGASNIFEGLNYKTGAPDVSYSESIIAFPYYNTSVKDPTTLTENDKYFIVADTDTSRDEIGKPQQTIKTGQTAAIFDAYISASRDDEGKKYRYTIEVEYKGLAGYTTCTIDEKASAISYSDTFDGKYFLIKTQNYDRWVYATDNAFVHAGNMSYADLRKHILENKDYSYVWMIEKVDGENLYYLRNAEGYYINNLSAAQAEGQNKDVLTTGNIKTEAERFTVSPTRNWLGTDYFRLQGNSNSRYLYNNDSDYITHYNNRNNSSVRFELYPVDFKEGAKTLLRKEIVLQTIDNETSAVSDVREIRRNDFVRILVEVSYNPDRGDFEFEVQPWNRVDVDDITFN